MRSQTLSRSVGVRAQHWVWRGLIHVVVVLAALSVLVPLVWIVLTSLKTLPETYAWPPKWLPAVPQWKNYITIMKRAPFARYYRNSVLVAVLATSGNVLFSSLAGYALAKFDFRGRKFLYMLVLATMMIPTQVTIVPSYVVLRALKLTNTLQGLVLPMLTTGFSIFLMRQFCLSIPSDLMDSGRVDGASEFQIYRRIVLPELRPALASVAIFSFMAAWNDFMWPLIVVDSPKLRTIPLGLAMLKSDQIAQWHLRMTGTVYSSIPVLIVFAIMQRQFIQGITLTGIKG